jgi:branched-chain amino acid transport system substrate-binding protein
MMRFARCLTAALVLLAWWLGPAGAANAATKGTVRVGLLDPASGAEAPDGSDVAAGFRYYLATHGDELGGFAVALSTEDEGSSTEAAVAAAHRMVEQDNVDAVVGVLSSADAYAMAPYIDEQKKLLIIAGAGADELTQNAAQKTIFRVAHTSSQDVMPLGDYVCHRLHLRSAVIVGADTPYGIEASGGFARAYTDSGCRVLQEIYQPTGTSDWSQVVGKIDKRAQVVFAGFGAVASDDAVAFLDAYRAAGAHAALATEATLVQERLLQQERERAFGIISGLHYAATLTNKVNVTFRLGYEALSNRPVSEFVENGYVAAQMLSVALDKLPAGPIKGDALLAALRLAQCEAPRGPVHFDRYQQVENNVYIRRVDQVGGRFRNDVIETFPAISQFWQYDPAQYLALPDYAKLKGAWARP